MSAEAKPRRGRPKNSEATAKRRDEILSSASQLFAAQGYAETNVDSVAAGLDISKATIYRYFSSKRELFFATVDREIQRLKKTVSESAGDADNPLDQIANATAAYLGFFKENPHAVELIMQERAAFPDRDPRIRSANENPMLERWSDSIQSLMDSGYVRTMPLDSLMEILSNLLYGTVMSDTLRRENLDLRLLSRNTLDVVLRGVTTEKARHEWGLKDD